MPSVRVYVTNNDLAEATELCVRSLRRFAGHPFELTVGDGGSTDGSLDLLRDMEERGWLSLEVDEGRPVHAEWLDRWIGECDAELAVFAHNDMEFLAEGWLRDLVETARDTGAALVYAEWAPEEFEFVEPYRGKVVRLAPKPNMCLMLLDVAKVRSVGASWGFHKELGSSVPEGEVYYDVGAVVYRELIARGLGCVRMPASYPDKYHHWGTLSWRATAAARTSGLRTRRSSASWTRSGSASRGCARTGRRRSAAARPRDYWPSKSSIFHSPSM